MQPQPSLMSQLSNSMAQGGSPMNVQTPGSPQFDPSLQMPSPTPMPDQSISSQFSPSQMQQQPPQGMGQQPQQMATLPIQDGDQQTPGVQVPASEAELIIKALGKRMQSLSKIHEMAAGTAFPQPEPPQAQQGV